ncbi:MAG: phospholipase D family protein [Xanthomonadales bacterium]|nr:phospholipase D family protein [Xanthomonadales bacterium]MBP7623722.1 phospholipase D family protein [Xanthomonadales bacterium]
MIAPTRVLWVLLAILLGGCADQRRLIREAEALVEETRPLDTTCSRIDRCAIDSPVVVDARTRTADGRHGAILLSDAEAALVARVHLIRAARESIELQTFIFADDDVGLLILGELLTAARRGVRVRVLSDQMFSIENRRFLARLAREHANFEFRLYNPTFNEARTAPLEFAAGILCCFFRFNQRSHNKLLLIDGRYGIVGGRNIEERYFGFGDEYNYYDRDLLVYGAVGAAMQASFDRFWTHPKTVPLAQLKDVAKRIVEAGRDPPPLPAPKLDHGDRLVRVQALAEDRDYLGRVLIDHALSVAAVEYFSDPPDKPNVSERSEHDDLTALIGRIITGAEHEIVLQTPYLVLSKPARKAFLTLRRDHPDLRVLVSTNSLAATDAFPVYAISHKRRRYYLESLGFEIHEFKPYPGRSEAAIEAKKPPGALRSALKIRTRKAVPLRRDTVRRGLHAKAIVVDGEISLIGSHNFDPRSEGLNSENGVIVRDTGFAAELKRAIGGDIGPDQSWVIAKKPDRGLLTPINQTIEAVSEKLPVFDLWPWRYATSYELRPECVPLPPKHPDFLTCYVRVGDFPEVDLAAKGIYTRIITAFGVGLSPIL